MPTGTHIIRNVTWQPSVLLSIILYAICVTSLILFEIQRPNLFSICTFKLFKVWIWSWASKL